MRLLLLLFLIGLPAAACAEYQTIDELVRAYGGESCRACHAAVHEEWQSSYHAHSVVNSLTVLRDFIENGLGRDWKKPVSKGELLRCMECHAPQLNDASESLAREVARLALTATDDRDAAAREAARKTLDRLNVNCVVCHNTKAGVEKNLKGAPRPGVYYGPTGKPSPAHGTARSTAITSSVFCGQCHGVYTAPDRETVFCTSLYESYQDQYRANGGLASCQECHMRADKRGHRISGRHDLNTVREGIAFAADVEGFRQHPGRWIPTAVVSVSLGSRAGHRIPDG
jgi:Zn-finger protein